MYCQKMSKSWYEIIVIKPKMDDKLFMTVFMHTFAWKDRKLPIRRVNSAKIWIIGAVLCSCVLNLCISIAITITITIYFLLWKVAYISASSYKMIWETLCKARHLGWNMCSVFFTTQRALNLHHEATSHWSTESPVSQVYDIITDIM